MKYSKLKTQEMFIGSQGLTVEYNTFADNLNKGATEESKTRHDKEYDNFVPAILEEKGETLIADLLKEYKERAAAANPPVLGAKDVTAKLLKGYCNASGRLAGIVRVYRNNVAVDNMFNYNPKKDTRDKEDETPETTTEVETAAQALETAGAAKGGRGNRR